MAARDSAKLTLVPIKLTREELKLPSFLTDIQYLRAWEYADPEAIVDRIIKVLP